MNDMHIFYHQKKEKSMEDGVTHAAWQKYKIYFLKLFSYFFHLLGIAMIFYALVIL